MQVGQESWKCSRTHAELQPEGEVVKRRVDGDRPRDLERRPGRRDDRAHEERPVERDAGQVEARVQAQALRDQVRLCAVEVCVGDANAEVGRKVGRPLDELLVRDQDVPVRRRLEAEAEAVREDGRGRQELEICDEVELPRTDFCMRPMTVVSDLLRTRLVVRVM